MAASLETLATPEGVPAAPKPRPSLLTFAREMLGIGITGFGGNLATRIEYVVLAKHGWMDEEEYRDAFILTGLVPGGNTTNLVLEIGRRLWGLPGLFVGFFCLLAPGVTVLLTLGPLYLAHRDDPAAHGILAGLECGTVALIGFTAYKLAKAGLRGATDVVLMLLAFVGLAFLRLPIEAMTLVFGIVGYALIRRREAA